MARIGPMPPRRTGFDVILQKAEAADPVLLCRMHDADRATMYFHEARQRLLQEQVAGELRVVQRTGGTKSGDPRTPLREPLRS